MDRDLGLVRALVVGVIIMGPAEVLAAVVLEVHA